MNSIKNYFWKYSSLTHIAFLILIAIVLVFFGDNLLGSNNTVFYPLTAVLVAGIEAIAIKTRPKDFDKNS